MTGKFEKEYFSHYPDVPEDVEHYLANTDLREFIFEQLMKTHWNVVGYRKDDELGPDTQQNTATAFMWLSVLLVISAVAFILVMKG